MGKATMNETTIKCPECSAEFRLTESLSAPLIEATRKEYEKRLKAKDGEVAKREAALQEREEALAADQESVDDLVEQRLKEGRKAIAKEEAKKARRVMEDSLEQQATEIATLSETLEARDKKLRKALDAQAKTLKKQRELDEALSEVKVTVQKGIDEGLGAERRKAEKKAEEDAALVIAERDHTIDAMKKQIGELKRKAEQGSQQLQGEVQELQLEESLSARFVHDSIEPVPKGEHGGDVVHRVMGPQGLHCGTILWESKRTKNWSGKWLAKLRGDQRNAKAELAVIVSQALPEGVESFELIDDVWVAHPRAAIPLATALRQGIVEAALARKSSEGQKEKAEMVYEYLTGSQFRQRVQAIVEGFTTLQEDLEAEKKAITRLWAKREQQINNALEATVGMFGDFEGIAGKTLPVIEGLALPMLEGPDAE